MIIDEYGNVGYTEKELIVELNKNPKANIDNCTIVGPSLYNSAIDANFSDNPHIRIWDEIDRTINSNDYHTGQSNIWPMPDEYRSFDIAKYLLDQCNNDAELQRMGQELLLFADGNLLPFLCYLKYMVDTLRKNGVVLGVGRGSSVASFALYKLGVHRINSLEFDIDIHEFLKG